MHKYSLICLIFVLLSFSFLIFGFNNHPEYYGDYKTGFKGDLLSQQHYLFVIFARICLAVIIVTANEWQYVGYVAMLLPVACAVYIAWRRPYLHSYNNWRAVANEAVVTLVLAMYAYYRSSVDHTQHLNGINGSLPWVEVSLLILCVCANIAFMVKYKIDRRKVDKEQAKKESLKSLEEEKSRLVEELSNQKMRCLAVTRVPSIKPRPNLRI